MCSSGIDQSKLRSPASTCTTGISSFTAASAAPSVELTSPATTVAAGRISRSTALDPEKDRGRLLGVRPRADIELDVGTRQRQLVEEDVLQLGVIVLARVNENLLVRALRRERREHGSDLHVVRARPDDVDDGRHGASLRPGPSRLG